MKPENRIKSLLLVAAITSYGPPALADMTVVDLSGIHHQPALRPVCCLTLSTMGSDVRHVMVNGEIVVENGRATKVDQDKIVADCIQASRGLIERSGIGHLAADWIAPDLPHR